MDQELLTYYPGVVIVLEVEIEHQPNFRAVRALFVGHQEEEDAPTDQGHHASMVTADVIVRETQTDGVKISTVRFELEASRSTWIPGLVYELAELRGETVGNLAGQSRGGSTVVFDMGSVEVSRLRFEEEAASRPTSLKSARLR